MRLENITLFVKKNFFSVFVDNQSFSPEKYHKNITFLSQG